MPRVMVTGAGLVGSQIIKLLTEEYHLSPVVVDVAFQWKYLETIVDPESFVPIEASIVDRQNLERIMKEHGIGEVIHTAAVLPEHVGHGAQATFVEVNAWGTANVMFAAVTSGVDRFVLLSTNSVYQFKKYGVSVPVNEEYPTGFVEGQSYGYTKVVGEYLLRELTKNGALDGKILRPGQIYGPAVDRRGDRPLVWKSLVDAAIEGRQLLLKGEPEQRMDWVYSKDVARLACRLLMADSTPHVEYNVGYGQCLGINDFVACLDDLFPGHRVKLQNCGTGGWNYPLDIGRACVDLEFQPQFDLVRGLLDYVRWYRSYTIRTSPNALIEDAERIEQRS